MKPSSPANAALHIGLFSFMIVGLVTLVFHATKDKIADNERQALISSLQTVLPQESYDNDLLNDVIKIQPYTIYRARKTNQPIAAIFISTTPHGYNGDIRLLIGINIDGKITAIRVLKHKETPGLGDKIETKKSSTFKNCYKKYRSDIHSL